MSSTKNSSIGVKLVSKGVDPNVDIVAVHGLKGDVYRTWTAKATEPGEKDVFWLKDLLPEEVPNARILAYGYDADPSKMFESISTNRIHHHATTLVSELHFYRRKENEKRRPIIFVCHSLGGIIVKRALIYSANCNLSHNIMLRSIKVSTYGILFLGTPHMGADLARWGKMAEMLVRMVSSKSWVDSNSALITALEKNSETLQNITEGFLGISRDFRLFFFWEELKTAIPGMGPNLIVEYASAVPEALPDAGRAAIHATHSEMCKFRDTETPGWNVLAGCLCDFVEQAPAKIEMNWAQEERRNIQAKHDLVSNIIQHDIHADVGLSPPPIMPRTRSPSPDAGTSRGAIMGQDVPEPPLLAIKDTPFVIPLSLQENRYFEGREDALLKLHAILQSPTQGAVTISGLSGAGKTHLAREYFFHRKSDYRGGAFWIDCTPMMKTLSTECLDLGFCMIAEELGLLGEYGGNSSSRVSLNNDPKTTTRLRVMEWFQKHDDWLLVLDGANAETTEEVDTLAEYIPKSKVGSIILTTLNSSFAGSARLGAPEKLELEPVTDEEAVRMLLHYAQIKNPLETELVAARQLVQHLACIPLAIHSAGSYIKGKKVSISDYLKKYEKRPFVDREDLEPFHIIFDRLEEHSDRYQEARNLLCLLAFMHREIPVRMLVTGIRQLPSNIKLIAKDRGRRDFNNTIGHLLAYSLVDRCGQQDENVRVDTLVLHSVVQDVCISRMRKRSELRKWLQLAIRMFCSSFDYMETCKRSNSRFLASDYRRYEVHGVRLLQHAKKREMDTEELVKVLGDIKSAINDDQAGVRCSMFRSGSASDSAPETPSPESSRRATWEDDPIHDEPEPIQDFDERRGRTPTRSRAGSRNPSANRKWHTPPLGDDRARDSDSEDLWGESLKVARRSPRASMPQIDQSRIEYRYKPARIPRAWVPGQTHVQVCAKPPDSQVTQETVIFSPTTQSASAPTSTLQSPTDAAATAAATGGTPSSSSKKGGIFSFVQSLLKKTWSSEPNVPTIAHPRPQWPNSPTAMKDLPHRFTFPGNLPPVGAGHGSPRPHSRGRTARSDLDHLHHPFPAQKANSGHGRSQSLSFQNPHASSLPARFGEFPFYDSNINNQPRTPINYPGEGGYLDMPLPTPSPRPFSAGYAPSRDTDLSSSPIARSVVGPRYRSPSLAWSEPIIESPHGLTPSPSPAFGSSFGAASSASMRRALSSTSNSGARSPRIAMLQAKATEKPRYSATPMSRVVSEPTGRTAGAPGLGIGGVSIPFESIPRVTVAPGTPDGEGGVWEWSAGGRRRSAPDGGLRGAGGEEVGSVDMVRSHSESESGVRGAGAAGGVVDERVEFYNAEVF
ncbi:hypothetical protein L873DRAFT_1006442 [Choiromyces venosus 120613-1]|uniref:DUF676 domain-containing protein n=1 Tax=Choiromyces venosus 120613-1 TaxID=1336337 RepID=A0A3N4JP01_9PEZI|nr:hypothetical protein L873DRAFT_1006442 [Choiromyces venosus 120613-1]